MRPAYLALACVKLVHIAGTSYAQVRAQTSKGARVYVDALLRLCHLRALTETSANARAGGTPPRVHRQRVNLLRNRGAVHG